MLPPTEKPPAIHYHMVHPRGPIAMPVKTDDLNEDLKAVREDLHKVEVSIRGDVRELSAQVKGILTSIRLLAALAITSLAASIWWGATLTADAKNLGARAEERARASDQRFDKIDARFDRLEASLGKILEQTRPVAPKAQ
jgi:hypothetical protein